MNAHRFAVSISADDCIEFYHGTIKHIVVRSTTGIRISIPVQNFFPFVTYSGIQGTFEVAFDSQNRIIQLQKIG